jgi:hypothetical protein
MSDKIRIVGAFGEGAVGKVQEFVKGLDGVESVSVLHDGIETYPDADSVKAAQGEGEGEQADESAEPTAAPDESASAA